MGGGERWRGGAELRGDGAGAKQKRKVHDKKGERWGEEKERWGWGKGKTCMRKEWAGKGGSSRDIPQCCPQTS